MSKKLMMMMILSEASYFECWRVIGFLQMVESELLGVFQWCKEVGTVSKASGFHFLLFKWLKAVIYRLLQEFVENHGNGLEVVYTMSGQLKSNPLSYHVRLVSGPQLAGSVFTVERTLSLNQHRSSWVAIEYIEGETKDFEG